MNRKKKKCIQMYEPQTGAVRGRGRTENNKSEMD